MIPETTIPLNALPQWLLQALDEDRHWTRGTSTPGRFLASRICITALPCYNVSAVTKYPERCDCRLVTLRDPDPLPGAKLKRAWHKAPLAAGYPPIPAAPLKDEGRLTTALVFFSLHRAPKSGHRAPNLLVQPPFPPAQLAAQQPGVQRRLR